MKTAVMDIFFLNIEDAYCEAVKQQTVVDVRGHERLQYCYYDGPLTDIVLDNFIQVASDNFVEFFSHNHLPIPELIAINQDGASIFNVMPTDVIEEIKRYRSIYKVTNYIHFDQYFVDPLLALNVAKQRNRVACGHPTIDGLQICYFRGELPEHGLCNLIHLELSDFEAFFVCSRMRIPEHANIPSALEEELKSQVKEDLTRAVVNIKQKRLWLVQQLLRKARALRPLKSDNEPLRVFLPASRLTTVMQYSSAGIAKAFENKDYQALLYIEANDMEASNLVDLLIRYIDFNPHVTFFVNGLNNTFLHDDVINIIWWQDPMPQIKNCQPLSWRGNDFNFSISPVFDRYLTSCNAAKVERMHFVIDSSVFYVGDNDRREDKVVFIGSSYLSAIDKKSESQRQAIVDLEAILERGGRFDQSNLALIGERYGLDFEFVFWKLLHYVIRDNSVRWLCQNSMLPVQVYGRYWDEDPLVAAHFRGELQHGMAVADMYRTARYALVCHPFEINSQRLAEVAACGCIPVVYDCRDVAEQPHWDDYCLFFKTSEDLRNILLQRQRPAKCPELLVEHFTYDVAVQSLIERTSLRDLVAKGSDCRARMELVIPELFAEKVVLHSHCEDLQSICRANLQKNLESLKQNRKDLFDMLLDGVSRHRWDVIIDKPLEGVFWEVMLRKDGEVCYRIDNALLLEHKKLIHEYSSLSDAEVCCCVLVGLGAGYELLDVFEATCDANTGSEGSGSPVYLIEREPGQWLLNLMLQNLELVIKSQRTLIFYRDDPIVELRAELLKFQSILPNIVFDFKQQAGLSAEQVSGLIIEAVKLRMELPERPK